LLLTEDRIAGKRVFLFVKAALLLIGIYAYSVLEILVLYWNVTGLSAGTTLAGVAAIARPGSQGAMDGRVDGHRQTTTPGVIKP
jgi:hypothetical protein